jgi:hypothetical protein
MPRDDYLEALDDLRALGLRVVVHGTRVVVRSGKELVAEANEGGLQRSAEVVHHAAMKWCLARYKFLLDAYWAWAGVADSPPEA